MRVRGYVVIGALAATSACTLFVSTGDLSNGEATGDGDDSGTAAEAGSTNDQTSPPALGDAAPGADAGIDAAPRVCDATFCDDFDDSALGLKWEKLAQSGGGALALKSGGTTSPNELFMTLAGTGNRVAYLEKTFSVTKSIRCAVNFRVDVAPPNSSSDVQILALEQGDKTTVVYLKLEGGAPGGGVNVVYKVDQKLADGGIDYQEYPFKNVALATWTRIELSTDKSQGTVRIDGETATHPFAEAVTGNVSFRAQLAETGDTDNDPSQIAFDDFECHVQ